MELLELVQGSQKWIDYRMECYSASYAPIVMGEERYLSRNQLLDHYKGWTTEVNEFTQSIYDKGHKSEEGARPIVSDQEFVDLKVVVAVEEIEGLKMLASYDGAELHLENFIITSWEHKLYNQVLYENTRNSVIEPFYYWQLEHQMMVAGTDSCIFTCSNGTEGLMATMTYTSQISRREDLIKAWIQFDEDLDKHEMVAKKVKLEKIKIKSLPELKVNVLSEIKSSNLSEYTTSARRFISEIKTELETDKDFEDAAAMVKHLTDSEKVLKKVEQSILDGNLDIKNLLTEIKDLKKYSADKRLMLAKLVKSQKDLKKENLKLAGRAKYQEAIAKLMVETKNMDVGFATPDFDLAIKGLSNFASMESNIDTAVANVNITNKELVEDYLVKESLADEMITDYEFLFSDIKNILLGSKENLINTIENTILKYKAKIEEEKKSKLAEEQPKQEPNEQGKDFDKMVTLGQGFVDCYGKRVDPEELQKPTQQEQVKQAVDHKLDVYQTPDQSNQGDEVITSGVLESLEETFNDGPKDHDVENAILKIKGPLLDDINEWAPDCINENQYNNLIIILGKYIKCFN